MNKVLLKNARLYFIRGFSLIEMLTTLAIVSVLSLILYYTYPQASLVLGYNLSAQELVSIIKKVQMYGSSQGGDYKGQGIYLTSEPNYNNQAIEFLDKTVDNSNVSDLGIYSSNKFYDKPDSSEPDFILKTNLLKNFLVINKIFVGQDKIETKELSITFVRPDTYAYITDLGNSISPAFYSAAYIELRSGVLPDRDLKCISIFKSGQINIDNKPCK